MWLLSDHLGSIRVEAGLTSGTVVDTIDYDAFGNVTANLAPALNSVVLFQGGILSSSTGLYHFGARDYNPLTQQWMETDPIGFGAGDSNLKRFVGNDPTNAIDPAGEEEWDLALKGRLVTLGKPVGNEIEIKVGDSTGYIKVYNQAQVRWTDYGKTNTFAIQYKGPASTIARVHFIQLVGSPGPTR